MPAFDLENYATVQERIAEFYQQFPDGSIRTFLSVRDGPEVIFEARVFRTPEEAGLGIYTSGWAREVEGANPINRSSHLEVGETSAVGQALANLGFATDKRRPTREEMQKARRIEEEHEAALGYIRDAGPQVSEAATVRVGGETYNLRAFTREQWKAIKARPALASTVAAAMRAAEIQPDASGAPVAA